MTDSIKLMAEQKAFTMRWVESLDTHQKTTQTGEEVLADIIQRHGLQITA